MQKTFLLPILLGFLFFSLSQNTLAQCPGCIVDVPAGIAEDTIFLGPVPDGQAGLSYDEDISFRLPKTTTPVSVNDPNVPPGFNIEEITIASLENIPPGLSWEANQDVYVPATQPDGCIKLCGTPLVSGWYTIEVKLLATVLVVTQEASVFIDLYIAPPVSSNAGFTMTNYEGCGEVEVGFINNIPSNGEDGYSYSWDFGNGKTSIEENPVNQLYNQPGTYYINYQATIDTFGYFLTDVVVEETDCNDWPNQPPDLEINIYDGNGVKVYQSPPQSNTWPPVSFPLNLKLNENENYSLKVVDADGGIDGQDDVCVLTNFNMLSNGEIVGLDWRVRLDIVHPVSEVSYTDTVIVHPSPSPATIAPTATEACPGVRVVFVSSIADNIQWYLDGAILDDETEQTLEVEEEGSFQVEVTNEFGCSSLSEPVEFVRLTAPDAPQISSDNGTAFCEGEETILMSSYANNNQWYLDGDPIAAADNDTYIANSTGIYTVEHTNNEGCSALSEELSITVNPNPDEPVFENINNVLTILSSVNIPDNHSIVWLFNGNVLEGEVGNTLCTNTPGTYAVLLTNEETGCSSTYTTEVNIDPENNCLVSSIKAPAFSAMEIFPNPVGEELRVSFELAETAAVQFQLFDASGRLLQTWELGRVDQVFENLDMSERGPGFYVLQIRFGQEMHRVKLIKQ